MLRPPKKAEKPALSERFSRFHFGEGKILVALSGWSDSVALVFAAIEYFGEDRVIVAHFNHALRGSESDGDQLFCQNLATRLGIGFVSERVDVEAFANERKTGIEDAARTLRYRFLQSASGALGASAILTGHTADDLAETVLMNFLRGSKARGWKGIPEKGENGVIRPFLQVRKSEILAFLQKIGQDFRYDSSNADPAYLRNRIRNRIIPEIETFNPGFATTARRVAEYATELEEYFDATVVAFFEQEDVPNTFEIARFETLPLLLRKEVLSRLYARENHWGIGLSEGMIEEMLRFCSLRYGGKSKTFRSLALTRKKNRIHFQKTPES